MESTGYVSVGRIVSAFGVKGEIKVLLDIEVPEQYRDAEKGFNHIEAFFIERQGEYLPYFIQWLHGIDTDRPILKLEGIDTPEVVQMLQGTTLYLPEDSIEIDTTPSRFGDIIGFMLVDAQLGRIGEIEDIYDIPMQELAQITYEGREVLIPLHEDFGVRVDQKKREVQIALPEGLLDLNSLDAD